MEELRRGEGRKLYTEHRQQAHVHTHTTSRQSQTLSTHNKIKNKIKKTEEKKEIKINLCARAQRTDN